MSSDEHGCSDGACGCGGPDAGAESAKSSILDELGDDEGFHPMGAGWEDEMQEMLEDTEYDAELGMEMARDAMRLVAGEITEEEFYDDYHEAVVREFDEDERPMAEMFDDLDESEEEGGHVTALTDLVNGDSSRRETMKKVAVGAGAVGLGGGFFSDDGEVASEGGTLGATGGDGDDEDDDHAQYGMVIDLDRCDGCLECVKGCMDENQQDTGANWMYVLTYQDEKTDQENFLVRPCQHCSEPPCAKVCPVNARHRREDGGFVLTDYEICIGCRYCQVACPYGVNYFGWGDPEVPFEELHTEFDTQELQAMSEDERREAMVGSGDEVHDIRGRWVDQRPPKGVMGKCTFCPARQDGIETPEHLEEKGLAGARLHQDRDDLKGTVACMDACDDQGMSAIHFGRMDKPDSRPNQYLETRKEIEETPAEKAEKVEDPEPWENPSAPHHTSQLSAFKLLDEIGTQPNITYLGNEPGAEADQTDNPPVDYNRLQTHDGRRIVDTRKDVTDQKTDFGAWEG